MNLAKFESLLFNNVNSKLIIVSFSATSNVTSQRTDLAGINSIIKKFKKEKLPPSHKFFFIVDCAAFCSHDRLDLSGGSKYDEIDFVCMSPHKHLGGSEAVGVLLVRLEAYD
jgi:selenocysteine lyase/cysteine desulfurase